MSFSMTSLRYATLGLVLLLLLALPSSTEAVGCWEELQTLNASMLGPLESGLGNSLAHDPTTNMVIVGAQTHSETRYYQGAAFVYHYDPLEDYNYEPLYTLVPEDGEEFDRFGYALAVFLETVFVSAPFHNTGTIYLHDLTNQEIGSDVYPYANMSASGRNTADALFGAALTLSPDGDILYVGAPYMNHGAGAVFIYLRPEDGLWNSNVENTVLVGIQEAGDLFGYAMAVSESFIVISAFGRYGFNGAVDVFNTTNYQYVQSVTSSEEAAAGQDELWFGYSVSLVQDTLVIGAPNSNGRGMMFVYRSPVVTTSAYGDRLPLWELSTMRSLGKNNEACGSSVSISDSDFIAIGCPAANNDDGKVFLYRYDALATAVTELTVLSPADSLERGYISSHDSYLLGAGFGSLVEVIDDYHVLVGADHSDAVYDATTTVVCADDVVIVDDCLVDCGTHGTCNTTTGICGCEAEYSGEACDDFTGGNDDDDTTTIDGVIECLVDCGVHGTCNTTIGICACEADYTGETCAVMTTYCEVYEPCLNNGQCEYVDRASLSSSSLSSSSSSSLSSSGGGNGVFVQYICYCADEYTGLNCSEMLYIDDTSQIDISVAVIDLFNANFSLSRAPFTELTKQLESHFMDCTDGYSGQFAIEAALDDDSEEIMDFTITVIASENINNTVLAEQVLENCYIDGETVGQLGEMVIVTDDLGVVGDNELESAQCAEGGNIFLIFYAIATGIVMVVWYVLRNLPMFSSGVEPGYVITMYKAMLLFKFCMTMFNFYTDIVFVAWLWCYIEYFPELTWCYWASLGFLVGPIAVKFFMMMSMLRADGRRSGNFLKHFRAFPSWTTGFMILATTNLGNLHVLKSKLLGLAALSAKFDIQLSDSIQAFGLVTNIVQDIPEMGIQIFVTAISTTPNIATIASIAVALGLLIQTICKRGLLFMLKTGPEDRDNAAADANALNVAPDAPNNNGLMVHQPGGDPYLLQIPTPLNGDGVQRQPSTSVLNPQHISMSMIASAFQQQQQQQNHQQPQPIGNNAVAATSAVPTDVNQVDQLMQMLTNVRQQIAIDAAAAAAVSGSGPPSAVAIPENKTGLLPASHIPLIPPSPKTLPPMPAPVPVLMPVIVEDSKHHGLLGANSNNAFIVGSRPGSAESGASDDSVIPGSPMPLSPESMARSISATSNTAAFNRRKKAADRTLMDTSPTVVALSQEGLPPINHTRTPSLGHR